MDEKSGSEKREEWMVYGKRWTGMRYHGRDIMVRADKYGLEIWLNRSQDRRRISWRQIVTAQFPQAVSDQLAADRHRTVPAGGELMATGYIRGLLPQRSKKKTFRAGRVTTIDERSRAKQGSRRYEGDYQRGGGGDYDSRLADGFRMLGDDDGLQ